MSWMDKVRASAHATLDRLPGPLSEAAHKMNEVLGRPLADADELADRRAFAARTVGGAVTVSAPTATPAATSGREQAPVIVYYMDKQKRDVTKLTDVLDANGVRYTATNIQEDPAAQYAVRRDSNGHRLPVVFIAGDCLGGRTELVNAVSSGELKKRVFGD